MVRIRASRLVVWLASKRALSASEVLEELMHGRRTVQGVNVREDSA
jgi:hypothetical protein